MKQKPEGGGHHSTFPDDLKSLNNLQIHQIEMEMNKEELSVSQFNPEASQKKYTALFDFAPLSYFALDQEGFIREVNVAGAKLLGFSKGALINIAFAKFIFSEDLRIFKHSWLNLFKTRDHQVCELRVFKLDGQLLWVRLDLLISEYMDKSEILIALTDINIQKNIDDVQSFLLGNSWSKSGKDFFEILAEYLAKALGMDYVCIDRLLERGRMAQTVAIYNDSHFEDNVLYKLEDTPCGKVVGQSICFFPTRVRFLFPLDEVLQQMVAESYAGITLWGSDGKPVGLIAVIGRKSLKDPKLTETVLKQVSIRAASELEHRQMEEALIKSRDELELIVTSRTAELQKTNKLLRNEISVRKKQEKSLRITEEKYRTVADFTSDWETWLGPDGKFIYVSPSCYPTTGYTVEEFMNDPAVFIRIAHPEDREIVENHYNDHLNGRLPDCSFDFRIITRNGAERWIGHNCRPVFDSDGKWIGQRGSNRDITDQKMAENVLLASQKQLRALTKRMDAIAEEERTLIAREIHDELGHLLTVLKIDIEGLTNASALSIESVKIELTSMISMVDALIDTVRKISSDLRPGILDHLGLIPAIEWQIRQFQMKTKINCEFDQGEPNVTFDKNETTTIYRILQEILTNVARHSKANKVRVSLNKKDDLFYLKATDNGIGFELKDSYNTDSLGLMGMRERALSIGGEIEIESVIGKGTTVTLLLRRN